MQVHADGARLPTYLNPNAVRRNRVELLPVFSGLIIASELARGPDIQL